jgi:SAM-dependent methyltransferase
MPEEELWATFFDPPAILHRLLFDDPEADVVEFGCGYGTFTIPAARRTRGLVSALEIDPAMIEAATAKAKSAGLANIRFIARDFVTDGTGLEAGSVDYAMLFNILHALDPMALLNEAHRVLRPGGKVGAIHWNEKNTPRGPDPSIRPLPEQCRQWIAAAGFDVVLPPTPLPPFHFGLAGVRA